MAWTETRDTAWGGAEIKIGNAGSSGAMGSSLADIGFIKEGSISLEVQDGTTKEWKATGGSIIDVLKTEPTLRVKCHVKNLNKSIIEKVWTVKDSNNDVEVLSLINSTKQSVQLGNQVSGSELLKFPLCSVEASPVYSEDAGYGLDITFTVLSPGKGKPLFIISKNA